MYVALLLPVTWLICSSWWTHSAERQLLWLFSVTSLVSEGFSRYSLILSESRLALSEASFFPTVHLTSAKEEDKKASMLVLKQAALYKMSCSVKK